MSYRNILTATAAAAALFGLAACGSATDGIVAADTQHEQSEVTTTPQYPTSTEQPPPLPLPTTSPTDVWEQAYLETLAERGIDLDEQAALDAADLACDMSDQGAGLLAVSDEIAAQYGLTGGDASYLYGAALLTCDYSGGEQ